MSAADACGPLSDTATRTAGGNRTLLVVAVMASTIMQALDATIANVALPYMQGQLGANSDEISWVLTSYLVAAAIMMPLTGFFTDRFGRRRYLTFSIIGFVIASMLCGLAQSLPQIVAFRLLQGACGAALVPLAQAIMADAFPPAERGRAMSIWSMGVMIGPIMGPSLGGWLTDTLSWRWAFFINLPVGIASLLLVLRHCPDTPRRPRSMDWSGLALISLAIACTQIVLDRGNEDDWFESGFITTMTIVAALSFAAFVCYALSTSRRPVFDITVLKDRNFLSASLVIFITGLSILGSSFVQPVLMEKMLNYPISATGLIMVPRGLATMISMRLTGRLIGVIETRVMVTCGALLCAAASFSMSRYNLEIDAWSLIWPSLLQGIGLGLVHVPLASLQLSTLRPDQISEGAGLSSLIRTMGQAFGISCASTLLTRLGQSEWIQLSGHISPFNPALQTYLHAHGVGANSVGSAALLAGEVARQAQMLALVNVMKFISWSCLLMLLFVPLVRPVKVKEVDPALYAD